MNAVYICELCREIVDPADPNVVARVQWLRTESYGNDVQWIEGLGHYFHRNHAPRLSQEWREPSK